jgi:hypothetical protein
MFRAKNESSLPNQMSRVCNNKLAWRQSLHQQLEASFDLNEKLESLVGEASKTRFCLHTRHDYKQIASIHQLISSNTFNCSTLFECF